MQRKLMEGQDVFFCNEECTLLGLVDGAQLAVIQFPGTGPDDRDRTLVVPATEVSDKRLDLEERYANEQRQQKKECDKLWMQAHVKLRELETKIQEAEKRVLRYRGLESYMDVLEGHARYLLVEKYGGPFVVDINDAKCAYDKNALAAIIYRHDDGNKVGMRIARYSDGSGAGEHDRCAAFKTLEEAREAFAMALEKVHDIGPSLIAECDRLGVKDARVEEQRKKYLEREKQDKLGKIERLKKDLAEAEKELGDKKPTDVPYDEDV